jgi:hypothetical protein
MQEDSFFVVVNNWRRMASARGTGNSFMEDWAKDFG